MNSKLGGKYIIIQNTENLELDTNKSQTWVT